MCQESDIDDEQYGKKLSVSRVTLENEIPVMYEDYQGEDYPWGPVLLIIAFGLMVIGGFIFF